MKRTRVAGTLGAYADIVALLDRVMAEGPLDLEMENEKAAFAFRHRVYRFRGILLRKSEADVNKLIADGLAAPGTLASSPYDRIYIQIEGPKLMFRLRDDNAYLSRLRKPDGSVVEEPSDPLEAEARALRNKLGLE